MYILKLGFAFSAELILHGTIPDEEIRRMMAESYDLVLGKNIQGVKNSVIVL